MPTPSEISAIVKAASLSINYSGVDNANQAHTELYLKSNLSRAGLKAGENVAPGFTSTTKEVNDDYEFIMGTGPVVFNRTPNLDTPMERLLPEPGDIEVTIFAYDQQYDEVEGSDPIYNDTPIEVELLTMLSTNGISDAVDEHSHRLVTAGSPQAVTETLTELDGMIGPWKRIEEYTNVVGTGGDPNIKEVLKQMIGETIVTDESITEIVDIITPLTGNT